MASTRRTWRAAFQPLRDAAAPLFLHHPKQQQQQQQQLQSWQCKKLGLILQDLLLHTPTLKAAAKDVPPQEVVGDLTLLLQAVMCEGCFEGNARTMYLRVCHTVNDVKSGLRLEFPASSLLLFSHFMRQMLASSRFSNVGEGTCQGQSGCLPDADEPDTGIETLGMLVKFTHENGSHLPAEEITALIEDLLPFIWSQNNEVGSQGIIQMGSSTVATSQSGSKILVMEQKECQRLAFLAIGNMFPRAGALISKETWNKLLQAFHKNLDILSLRVQSIENAAASRFYAAILRCLHLILTDAKWSLEEHIASFVAFLRMFFVYGLGNSQFSQLSTKSHANKTGNIEGHPHASPLRKLKTNGVYRPPHLRSNPRPATTSGGSSDDGRFEADGFMLSSDSEQSDSDGANDLDNSRFSRIRINAILTIQAIAHVDPKSLHAYWSLLLPTYHVLLPRPHQATLLTVLLFDPVAKARMAAAAAVAGLLEGPSRDYLQVAEYKEVSRTGSYTTLSSSLGQMLVQLHTGFAYVISNECHCGTYLAALKAFSLLVSATPFERLPFDLLCNLLLSLQNRAHRLVPVSSDGVNMLVASINGVATCLNVAPSCPRAANFLLSSAPTESHLMNNREGALFLDLITYARVQTNPAITIEAFQALKSAVHNYSPVLFGYWNEVSSLAFEAMKGHGTATEGNKLGTTSACTDSLAMTFSAQGKVSDEKIAYSGLKLLDEFLRAMSGFQGTDETATDIPLHPPSPSELPVPSKILPSSFVVQEETKKEISNEVRGSMHWMEALKKHLPEALASSSSMVRGAALTCFAGLTSWVFSSLSAAQQDYILSTVINAAVKDEAPVVRSSACRALGVLVGFSEVTGRKQRLAAAVDVITSASFDTSLLVRITASWAVANTCDALCRGFNAADFEIMSEKYILGSLMNCALQAAKDGDKVRANAVRALGNIAKFFSFGCACEADSKSLDSDVNQKKLSLREIVKTLMLCMQIGNVKVQWNVCHALGNLFQNQTVYLREMSWMSSICKALIGLIQDSANFKIRIHAASALSVPDERDDYGEAYADVLQGLVHAMELCNSNPVIPSKLKYQAVLLEQLNSTTLHILSIVQPADYISLQDFLNKKADFLHDWLKSVILSAAKAFTLESFDSMSMEEREAKDLSENEDLASQRYFLEAELSYSHYDEKPLPPPREKYWFFPKTTKLQGMYSNQLSKRIMLIGRTSRALVDIFACGENENRTKFQYLLREIEELGSSSDFSF